jgi:TrmH family RNA methyltransferase
MYSNNQRKLILQLNKKKFRLANKLFVAEGKKVVNELINAGWSYKMLFSTEDNFNKNADVIKDEEMKKITHFNSPSPVLGVFELPDEKKILAEPTTIVVDGISDPGNLGTIIRLCDWFGLSELFCSNDTVDCYNPKVIQASAGSIVRVTCHYFNDLGKSLESLNKPIFGTTTNGDSIYSTKLSDKASYVFGSEAHGISESILSQLNGELSVPEFRVDDSKPESLNVATTTAIFLSELNRNKK